MINNTYNQIEMSLPPPGTPSPSRKRKYTRKKSMYSQIKPLCRARIQHITESSTTAFQQEFIYIAAQNTILAAVDDYITE